MRSSRFLNILAFFSLLTQLLPGSTLLAGIYSHTNNGFDREYTNVSIWKNEINTYKITSSYSINVKWYKDDESQGHDVEIDLNTTSAQYSTSFSSTGSHFVKAEIFNLNWGYVCYVKWNLTVSSPDTEGPYAPGNIRMSQSHDTAGKSDSDGITYTGNPRFEWTKPSDRGTSGTNDFYQWAITTTLNNPWDGPRVTGGYTINTYVQPGTLGDSLYKFWVQAEDNANNWGDWDFVILQIDTVDPQTPYDLTNPGGSSSTTDTTPNVSWSGVDNSGGSDIWIFEIFFDGTGGNPDHTYVSGDTTLDDVDFGGVPLEDGAWTWRVKAIDVAGNDTVWSTTKDLNVLTGLRNIFVSLEPEAEKQVIDGFGGSFAFIGYNPDDTALNSILDLGINIIRTQGAVPLATYDNIDGPNPSPEVPQPEKYRSVLERATNSNPNIEILLSFWRPWWDNHPSDIFEMVP